MKLRLALVLLLVGSVALPGGRATGSRSSPEPAPGEQSRPTLVFDGLNYLVAWADGRDRLVRALGTDNSFRPQPPPPPPPPKRSALYRARVTPSGLVLDKGGSAITKSDFNELSGAQAVSNGSSSLLVWTDRRNGLDYTEAARVARNGALLDQRPIVLDGNPSRPGYNLEASAASDGQSYLVVWAVGSDLFTSVVTSSGDVLSPPRRVHAGFDAAVAFDGTNYLVVWAENRFPAGFFIYAARVSRDGEVLDPDGILVAQDAYFAPKVAFNGTNYLVVWGTEALFGKRIGRDGHVLDEQPISLAATGGDPYNPDNAVASDGVDWLVAWSRESPGSIVGTRVGADGAVLDPGGILISSPQRNKRGPAIAFAGRNYLVAWADDRDLTGDIYGARVSSAGRVLDPSGILISTAVPPKPRCVVPRVIGMALKTAKRTLRNAHCSAGAIRRRAARNRRGRVVAQSPRPGIIRPSGYPVRLVVGRAGGRR